MSLNKGRCSRCRQSERKEIRIGNLIDFESVKNWLWCKKHKKFCKGFSSHCKENSMGDTLQSQN